MHYLYRIYNILNGKNYIGQTNDPRVRWNRHKCEAKNKLDYPLYNSINKYGLNNFLFETIASCLTKDDANYIEAFLIQQYNSLTNQNGYNIKSGGANIGHPGKKKLSIEQEQDIINQYKSGHGCNRIGQNLNFNPVLIFRVLKRNNIQLRENKGFKGAKTTFQKGQVPHNKAKYKLSIDQIKSIKEDKRSYSKLAKEYGVSISLIQKYKRIVV